MKEIYCRKIHLISFIIVCTNGRHDFILDMLRLIIRENIYLTFMKAKWFFFHLVDPIFLVVQQ